MSDYKSSRSTSCDCAVAAPPKGGWAAVALAWLYILSSAAWAGNPSVLQYVNSADSGQATVSGTSTLHDWTVKGNVIKGNVVFSGELNTAAPPITLQSIDLVVPVDSLKSTEGDRMDNTMYDALKLKQYPTITYKLTAASLKSVPSQPGAAYHFGANGQLIVAGTSHPIYLDLAVVPHDDGRMTITTDVGMKMTDCGVTPPTAMLGMIKSGDIITVNVTWQLTKATLIK